MIDIGKLYCDGTSTGDGLRYGTESKADAHGNAPHRVEKDASQRRPIVVWNTTRTCNLKCVHCYTDSENRKYSNELTTKEALKLIDELSDFGIPSLLFSGGEPFMREDLFKLLEYAARKNVRPVISTNGTLIDRETAQRVKDSGVVYVGISLDGLESINDRFRGVEGAFTRTMKGFDNCRAVNQRVGLRLTLTKRNYEDLHGIFDFIEKEGINRACFYHLVYSGRGSSMYEDDLSHGESRHAMDIILQRTDDYFRRGLDINILTVDNHADGVYLYLKMKEQNREGAEDVYSLLKWNGGAANSSGVGIANIDFNGNVHPDQFWQDYTFGNIRERNFGDIWMDERDPLMHGLKHKKDFIKGRCKLCRFRDLCTGSMRVRGYRAYGDFWAPDPQCYLTDAEIGLDEEKRRYLKEIGEEFPIPSELAR
ncbi:MAG TPA: radical SAM protein [Spirochaetota bacterium]|jgi:radical SAM protein with 4Fe4S-binding SPASM domain|nr:radical SAM protein [Spirochaetota bacterium]OQA99149.1 MAG: Antilisterial bacteriocin subtilosin biosynthesis protein AlbA [Spirochaetes bacterium ADurb.Bin218]HOK02883.1 radical SAM protein [Spirochaetota bacterium]HOK92368.1 radical SAM protein [Spirochaetota bacterium]HON15242.1 radical SAM protein [Spirochaetota bacterium]